MVTPEHYSRSQAIAKWILPAKLFSKIEAESKCWTYECTNCKQQRSVWDMGGMRYFGTPARKFAICTGCKKAGLATVTHKAGHANKQIMGESKNAG